MQSKVGSGCGLSVTDRDCGNFPPEGVCEGYGALHVPVEMTMIAQMQLPQLRGNVPSGSVTRCVRLAQPEGSGKGCFMSPGISVQSTQAMGTVRLQEVVDRHSRHSPRNRLLTGKPERLQLDPPLHQRSRRSEMRLCSQKQKCLSIASHLGSSLQSHTAGNDSDGLVLKASGFLSPDAREEKIHHERITESCFKVMENRIDQLEEKITVSSITNQA